ncbi:MAG: DUF799 family lipoprotein [Paraperlucidibaca sp.]|jgi:hypothetical protein|uniref:DUF799 domain-containing protein n=1 Tax=Paraperlucidibaca sp. TaxID=2708021 RepID=UPI001B6D0F68|nr:DUF799 family lipoprotein [Paraperlucidibaca sp.]|tara:strand:- start:326 stop:958 length:633 start_codon:yes stop_codon:yes gene_type:complete
MIRLVSATLAIALLAGCAAKPAPRDYSAFNRAAPRSILILPVVNRSNDVEAPNYFLSTIAVPFANRGFYVFPVNAVKSVMDAEGMADADLAHRADPTILGNLFGADAIMYVTINRWDARYAVLNTTVTVDFDYEIKDGRNGESLWKDKQTMLYSPQQNNSSGNLAVDLVVMAVTAMATKAKPNYLPLTRTANGAVSLRVPQGPYIDKALQ